ncbi:MAG: cytochrome ubiquinol oxidase subunit I, partial [Desulfomonile tiedjei]|nr:cytochrome ubiquinol oxidase subunit I [Desulfomonile tiedjei]
LPYVALELGWTVTEMGRQPWIVYGMMKTTDAASTLAGSQVGLSLGAFILVYSFLGVVCFYLISKYARQGPAPYAPKKSEKPVGPESEQYVRPEPEPASAGNN